MKNKEAYSIEQYGVLGNELCGCSVERPKGGSVFVRPCQLHAAAHDLLAAAKLLDNHLPAAGMHPDKNIAKIGELFRLAINKAEGR